MKKVLIIGILAVAFLAISAKATQALIPLDPGIIVPPLKKIEPPLKIDPNVIKAFHDARCAKFKDKMEEKISHIDNIQENHKNAYSNISTKLLTLINRLKDKGYDTGDLEADLATLNTKIATFKDDFNSLSEKMRSTKDAVCDDTDAKIKTNLGGTRTLIITVRKDAKAIRDYYKDEIRPDIKAIKNQTPENF